MIVIESTGRKLKDAIDNGLNQLGKTLDEVEVEIIDNGGLFRKAKVRISVQGEEPPIEKKEEPAKVEQEVKAKSENRERPIKEATEPKPEKKREQREAREPKQDKPKEQREHKAEKPREQKAKQQEEKKPRPEQKEEENVQREPRQYEAVTPEVVKKAEDFVTTLIEKMDVEAKISTEVEDGRLKIDLGTESSTLIGYHGDVLDSIEYLTNYIINHESEKFYHVVVDCNGYREKRKESLIALANKMAAKCIKIRHKITLEPMNSNERKIIHSALADNDQIFTRSEGHEPNRHVVILYNKKK